MGGIIECAVLGLPVGLGGPLFDGMEGKIASIIFGIPAVKGIEFGAGFAAAALRGSENNDAFTVENGTVKTVTNHCGGILGGITNGMPLTFRDSVQAHALYRKGTAKREPDLPGHRKRFGCRAAMTPASSPEPFPA